MESNAILVRDTTPVAELVQRAVDAVVNGEVDPITAHINISRMEAAIKAYKENAAIKAITLDELQKYGKKKTFGDCTLEMREGGVKYDYTNCGDSQLLEMYDTRDALLADIKERENTLKNLPLSGMADPHTGEVIYPPAKSSKTIIATTFKKS